MDRAVRRRAGPFYHVRGSSGLPSATMAAKQIAEVRCVR